MAAPESDRLRSPPHSILASVAPSNEAKLDAHGPDASEPQDHPPAADADGEERGAAAAAAAGKVLNLRL